MSTHLKMPCANHTRKISDDLKWGPHVGGTLDDPMHVQRTSAHHHSQYDHERIPGKGVPPMEIRKVQEGRTPEVLKKK